MEKIAIVFDGEGVQSVDVIQELLTEYPLITELLNCVNEIIGIDLLHMYSRKNLSMFDRDKFSKLFLFVTEYVQYKRFEEIFPYQPFCMVGYDIGEYSALCCSGAIGFEHAIEILWKRFSVLKGFCSEMVYGMTPVEEIHSDLIKNASIEIEKLLRDSVFQNMHCIVLSGCDAMPYRGKDDIIYNLKQQIVKPVQREKIADFMKEKNVTGIVVMGLSERQKSWFGDRSNISCWSYCSKSDLEKFKSYIKPEENRKKLLERILSTAVCIKNNNEDVIDYQERVVSAYRSLQDLYEKIEKQNRNLTVEEMKQSIELLVKIYEAKKSEECKWDTICRILHESGTEKYFSQFDKL